MRNDAYYSTGVGVEYGLYYTYIDLVFFLSGIQAFVVIPPCTMRVAIISLGFLSHMPVISGTPSQGHQKCALLIS